MISIGMDPKTYQEKLEYILANRKRSLYKIYQFIFGTRKWKQVSVRCNICQKGFNQNANGNFETHICKIK